MLFEQYMCYYMELDVDSNGLDLLTLNCTSSTTWSLNCAHVEVFVNDDSADGSSNAVVECGASDGDSLS